MEDAAHSVETHVIIILFSIAVAFGIMLVWENRKLRNNLPPGPTPRPIVGNIWNLLDPVDGFSKLCKKYGSLFTLKVGRTTIIVANGYETIKELFVTHSGVTSERPDIFTFQILKFHGIVAGSGKTWKHHKALALTALRELGSGKASIEMKIMEEIEECIKQIESKQGEGFDPDNIIQKSISNVICSVAFGQRFDYNDTQFERLLRLLNEDLRKAGAVAVINFFPFLSCIPGDIFEGESLKRNISKVLKFINDQVDNNRNKCCGNIPDNFISFYLNHVDKMEDTEERKDVFTDEQLLHVVGSLFVAGTVTTATSILWAILFFLHAPSVQQTMHEELCREVGNGRFPSLADKEKLPYCQAVITEVLRCGNVVPMSIPHAAGEDFMFQGFTIPKGTMLIPNMHSVLYDENVFVNPQEFNPSRYIDVNGDFRCPRNVIPFFLGRRKCLGEHLARSELFLFLTSLVQRFRFEPINPRELPTRKGEFGATNKPSNFKIHAMIRT